MSFEFSCSLLEIYQEDRGRAKVFFLFSFFFFKKKKKICKKITKPLNFWRLIGSQEKPLRFVQVTEKGVAESKLLNPYRHVTLPGKRYFKVEYLKFVQSRNISMKQLGGLSSAICLSSDEIYDTYVDIDSTLKMDINGYSYLLYKTRI